MANNKRRRIGFVATRLAGTDGVTLETEKWATVLKQDGHRCFYFGGELNTPAKCSYLVKEAHFNHPLIKRITASCFNTNVRSPELTKLIHEVKERLKNRLYRFINKYNIDLLILENSLAIPLNIPLGIAIAEVISETGLAAIAHHHDLYWERKRFLRNSIHEYLGMAFPPNLPSVQHVVINSLAATQLGLRSGISATIIPNVMDFENPPQPVDKFAQDVRKNFGLADDEIFILQPTRVIKRKRIEHAIELAHRLKLKAGLKAKLVVSHAAGDEGSIYEQRVKEYAKLLGVNALFVSKNISNQRGRTRHNNKIYALADIYPHADLVTFPSSVEGFGNAFLEAIYFKKPIILNRYPVYVTDIQPHGFQAIEFDEFVTDEIIEAVAELLKNPKKIKAMVEHNYRLAAQIYSYSVLRRKLQAIIANCNGLNC